MKKQSEIEETNQDEQLDEGKERKQEEFDRLKTKQLPAIVMLTGGAVSAVVTFARGFTLKEMLVIVLCSLLGFYLMGLILKSVFDSFRIRKKEPDAVSEEGEVIEKEPEGESAGEEKKK